MPKCTNSPLSGRRNINSLIVFLTCRVFVSAMKAEMKAEMKASRGGASTEPLAANTDNDLEMLLKDWLLFLENSEVCHYM